MLADTGGDNNIKLNRRPTNEHKNVHYKNVHTACFMCTHIQNVTAPVHTECDVLLQYTILSVLHRDVLG